MIKRPVLNMEVVSRINYWRLPPLLGIGGLLPAEAQA